MILRVNATHPLRSHTDTGFVLPQPEQCCYNVDKGLKATASALLDAITYESRRPNVNPDIGALLTPNCKPESLFPNVTRIDCFRSSSAIFFASSCVFILRPFSISSTVCSIARSTPIVRCIPFLSLYVSSVLPVSPSSTSVVFSCLNRVSSVASC